MNEKPEKMADKPKQKRKKIGKYDVFILLIGIAVMVVGIAGIVININTVEDYSNSTDIRTVDAVIETIERSRVKHEDEEDRFNKHTNYIETTHKMKVFYVVDGKTYRDRYDVTTYSDNRERDQFYHQLKTGDTIPVEVYKSRNGEYKIADPASPVDFLYYCIAIPVGLIVTAVSICDMVRPVEETANGKGKKRGKGNQRQTR